MKKLFVLALFLLPAIIFAQTKVAIYVTATDKVPLETKKIIGSEMVASFAATQEYSAIERTTEFLGQISKEQEYQRGGSVDDSQICELGRQFGVDLVCVTDITKFEDKYYIQARLIDVEKAMVLATAREISGLEDLETVIKIAQSLSQKLIETEVTYTLTIENIHSCPLDIYITGEYIGQVPAKTLKSFNVKLNLIGKIEAKETKGLLKKKEENTVKKMKAREVVTFTF